MCRNNTSVQWAAWGGWRIIGIVLLWGAVAAAQDVSSAAIEILPPRPTPNDFITVRLFGTWPDSCVPQVMQTSSTDNEIRIELSSVSGACLTILRAWEQHVSIGQLAAGRYEVIVRHTPPAQTKPPRVIGQTSFTVGHFVGGTVTGVAPRRILCKNVSTGQMVLIQDQAQSWDCQAAGLAIQPGDRVLQTVIGIAD
jgi:hypothetical protein